MPRRKEAVPRVLVGERAKKKDAVAEREVVRGRPMRKRIWFFLKRLVGWFGWFIIVIVGVGVGVGVGIDGGGGDGDGDGGGKR